MEKYLGNTDLQQNKIYLIRSSGKKVYKINRRESSLYDLWDGTETE